MKSRIEILKDIMETEKQFAMGEIDSETFEDTMQKLEKQLKLAQRASEEEIEHAVDSKELPLFADSLVGTVSIEELFPSFNVPRTFYRHLKIRREIIELRKNINQLKKDLKKTQILLAEKKISPETADLRYERLEFDLRLAENRLSARQKYLKRNPTKGDLLKFTLENYRKFSFGHGVEDQEELQETAQQLNKEIELRKKYREALAEMLATVKTSQLEISSAKTRNGLPDFKQLRDYQNTINELYTYIRLLSEDIQSYQNCLTNLQKDNVLFIDESHELFSVDDFGIAVLSSEEEEQLKQEYDLGITNGEEEEIIIDNGEMDAFNIDVSPEIPTVPEMSKKKKEKATPAIPETPQPAYQPSLDIEIIGMEDFKMPFEIDGRSKDLNTSTEQIIYQSFEGLLTRLIKKEGRQEISKPVEMPDESALKKPIGYQSKSVEATKKDTSKVAKKHKVDFSPLAEDITKKSDIEHQLEEEKLSSEIIQAPLEEAPPSETDSFITEIGELEEIQPLQAEELDTLAEEQIDDDSLDILTDEIVSSGDEMVIPDIPSPETQPKPVTTTEKDLEALTEEMIAAESTGEEAVNDLAVDTSVIEEVQEVDTETQEVEEEITDEVIETDLIKPQKKAMVSQEMVEAATEAWMQAGKAVFDYKDNLERVFLGYIQEVIVFDNNKLGYSIVSESLASQAIIDNIFNQIKPLWVSEDLVASPDKRRNFLIDEVANTLNISKDVALHITKLEEFTSKRNVDYPHNELTDPPEMIGIVPIEKIRIKRGAPSCNKEDVLKPRPYRTAPWKGAITDDERYIIGKDCYFSFGSRLGKVIQLVPHPLMGTLLLIETDEPDATLIDYLEQRLDISEKNARDRVWLVKYLIAKQLQIPEGQALKPKTLINYALNRGFPILPNEILNSFRVFVSGGSIKEVTKRKIMLKTTSRVFHPSEVFPLECLRIRTMQGKHIGTSIGISLSNKPVILVSEKLSREVVSMFTDATIEKQAMEDISQAVRGSIGVDIKDSLCVHNIMKTLIATRKIQHLTEYGKYLSKMNVTGIDLSKIQVVERGTIFLKVPQSYHQRMFS